MSYELVIICMERHVCMHDNGVGMVFELVLDVENVPNSQYVRTVAMVRTYVGRGIICPGVPWGSCYQQNRHAIKTG